jgi:hypothetical protein
VDAWSIRQMAVYQTHDSAQRRGTVVLMNPAKATWRRLKEEFKDSTNGAKPSSHWTVMLSVVLRSLTAHWADYAAALHKAVSQIVREQTPEPSSSLIAKH